MNENEIKKLYRHLEGWDNYDTWYDNYPLLQSGLAARAILPYIHRGIRDHTSHGIDHSVSVIRIINNMIDIIKKNGRGLSQVEIRLLYISAWLHDIGNLKVGSRKKHSLVSCELLDILKKGDISFGYSLVPLRFIIKYHSKSYEESGKNYLLNIADVPDKIYQIKGDKVRLRLLCGLFRLADACDIGKNRAFKIVYNLIKDEFKKEAKSHWESNNAIINLTFNYTNKCIELTVNSKKRKKAQLVINNLKSELKSVKTYIKDYFPCEEILIDYESAL